MPQLPLYPPPKEKEWIGSWVTRLAHTNDLSAPRLLKILEIDQAQSPGPREFRILAEETGISVEDIAQMRTPVDPLLERGVPGNQQAAPIFGVRYMQVCSLCLEEDEIPYIRQDWVRRSVGACVRHEVPLRDACPHCQRYLQVMKPGNATIYVEGRISEKWRIKQNLRQCWLCGKDLVKPLPPRLPGADSLAAFPPSRILMGTEIAERPWENFTLALWTLLNRFGLTQIVEAEAVPVRALRKEALAASPHSVEARLAAQMMLARLLRDQGDDGFGSRYARLRTWAAATEGALVHVDVNSRQRWLYPMWLLTRLIEDAPREWLTSWPALVEHLVTRMDERPGKPTLAALVKYAAAREAGRLGVPPLPHQPLTLTDDQWALVLGVLRQTPNRENVEGLFTLLLTRVVFGHPYTSLPGMSTAVVQKENLRWQQSGQVGLILHLLHTQLEASFPKREGRQTMREWAYRETDEDWRTHTARLLLSDGVIELARQVNRPLHRKLVLTLVQGGTLVS